MSTTEALRTQLDALQTRFLYVVEVENLQLRDADPQRSEAMELK